MSKRRLLAPLILLSVCFSSLVQGATTHHRVVWDDDPSSTAVIGFSPDGTSNSPYVRYGYSTNESQWFTANVDNTQIFAGSLTSHFVRLAGLNANSAVHYRVCDQSGCGQRFWFKTAPTDNSPYVMVAGGDTRTGWSTRRAGNTLISKIRPLFIMHGGDFTDANSAYQMNQYLSDWSLTYSDDTINGVNYKRIYPFIPTHGNHEDNDFKTLCRVFGVDYYRDGSCTNRDTYSAISISPLLRVYTLNSQYQNSGWSSYASAMNNWLVSDLSSFRDSAVWRFAQYHKPMFPHYTGKSENPTLHTWWAGAFYDYAMNLVVESDTHMAKLTEALQPSGNGFTATTNGGTVFVGEGSWGAPARSANDGKSWTIDLASIQQFKVVSVQANKLDVRTAQFNASASRLTREERLADPLVLPANVNWWSANSVGESMTLVQNNSGRSIIDRGQPGGGNSVTIPVSEDTFISRTQNNSNFDGSSEQLLADGNDSSYGSMMSLLRFDVSGVRDCEKVTGAEVRLNIFNASSGSYGVYASSTSVWQSSSVTWNTVGGNDVLSNQLATFNPSSTGARNINLGSRGNDAVQTWLQGSNTGIVIASTGTTDGIDIYAMESGNGASLALALDSSACDGDPGPQPTPTATPVPTSTPQPSETVTIYENRDTTISSRQPDRNLNSALSDIEADGRDGTYGEMMALIGFPVSEQMPACSTVTDVKLILNIDNRSGGTYGIYSADASWTADGATWNNVGGSSVKGNLLGEFSPSSLGTYTYSLSSSANALVEAWLNGGNDGIVIASMGTSDGVIIEDGGGDRARLQVSFSQEQCSND